VGVTVPRRASSLRACVRGCANYDAVCTENWIRARHEAARSEENPHGIVATIQNATRSVRISILFVSVRWTGHFFAISISCLRCASSNGPANSMLHRMRSILDFGSSQFAQSSAWTRSCRSRTMTCSRGRGRARHRFHPPERARQHATRGDRRAESARRDPYRSKPLRLIQQRPIVELSAGLASLP
jgi:hypothetical protein